MHRLQPQKVTFSRRLRKSQTPTEQLIWSKIRSRQLNGSKFRRQQIIGQYITDFYCAENKLIIEIDGDVHDLEGKRRKDDERDQYFNKQGYRIIHFTNDDVVHNLDGVLQAILELLPSPQPSP